MNDKVYVVTCIDYSDSSDGRPRYLGMFEEAIEAKSFVDNDIREFIDNATDDNGNCDYVADFSDMSISCPSTDSTCVWNIEETERPSFLK